MGNALDIVRCIPGHSLVIRILLRVDAQLLVKQLPVPDHAAVSPVAKDAHIVADQLIEVAILGGDDDLKLLPITQGIACQPIVCFAIFRFPMADAHMIQRLVDIRKLGKGRLLLRQAAKILPVGLVSFVQLPALGCTLSVEEHRNMRRFYEPHHLQQRSHEAQGALDRLSVGVDDP